MLMFLNPKPQIVLLFVLVLLKEFLQKPSWGLEPISPLKAIKAPKLSLGARASQKITKFNSSNTPSSEKLNFVHKFSQAFSLIAEKMGPSVAKVKIQEELLQGQRTSSPFRIQEEELPTDDSGMASYTAGSAFVVDEHGILATSYHVVRDSNSIEVAFKEGTSFGAKLIAVDQTLDLALLQLMDIRDFRLKPVVWGDSESLRVGEGVVVIGHPFGMDQTVTVGIISGTHRTLRYRSGIKERSIIYRNLLQTDSSIHAGNSGGPWFNLSGEVIGISTLLMNPGGGSGGIGFAIPSNEAQTSIQRMITARNIIFRELGIVMEPYTHQSREMLENRIGKKDQGGVIAEIKLGSVAEIAGLLPNDVLLTIEDQSFSNESELARLIIHRAQKNTLRIEILRRGQRDPQALSVKMKMLP